MPEKATPKEPTQAEKDAILGDGRPLLEAFLERNPELRPEWKYYGPKHGWTLKVFRKKRNMCFVGPEPGAIAMGFLFGDRAHDHLRGLELGPALREKVESAKRYPEGHSVRLVLGDESDLDDAQLLLDVKRSV